MKKEHVGPIVLFCSFSDAVLIIAGVSGMGALLGALPQVTKGFTLAGAGFLFWYGLRTLRQTTQSESMKVTTGASVSLPKALASVAAFTWLNPHVYLDTVLLMGTASTAQPLHLRSFFAAGEASASFLWFGALGYGARFLQPLFATPKSWQILDLIIGCVMLFLAILLLRQGL
ncbi:LysE/ArgO family amino acid transporter [Acetobacter senegalensis]|uniref:LysE/ArgO family amino acid transporter n=1 Tax=Acetobacter senegalensis TaxID=446692 RepID=UPI00200EC3C1|nr:LysE family transporter [Acetobacter senegalensis]